MLCCGERRCGRLRLPSSYRYGDSRGGEGRNVNVHFIVLVHLISPIINLIIISGDNRGTAWTTTRFIPLSRSSVL